MKRRGWVVIGVMFWSFAFLSSPDVSQATVHPSPNPNDNGNPASTVNPPGLAPFPPGWSKLPPPYNGYHTYPPGFGGIPLGQRAGFQPPGQTQTPPGQGVTSPGHTQQDQPDETPEIP